MRVEQEKVRMFHEKYGFPVGDAPQLIDPESAARRSALMQEELKEWDRANYEGDLVGVADGLADLLYTVLGTAVEHGIEVQPLLDEVHRSNMTKDLPSVDNPNKPIKGPSFEPPRVAELLLMQSTKLNDWTGAER